MSSRANTLADRIEQGARALALFAESLSEAEWQTLVPNDGQTVGTLVHHVATVYPIEVDLAQQIADGKAITDVTWATVAKANALHGQENRAVTKQETLTLLRQNSKAAADRVRQFTEAQLDTAAACIAQWECAAHGPVSD